jgi:hypothetical protein
MGLAVVDSLRAEEEAWPVGDTFVQPVIFEAAAGSRSVIVYGEPGVGKTTLRKALETTQGRFCVRWTPTPNPSAREEGTAAVRAALEEVFQAAAMELAARLLQDWARLERAPLWAQRTTGWFLRRYLPDGLESPAMLFLLEEAPAEAAGLLRELWENAQPEYIKTTSPYRVIVDHVMKTVAALGWAGAWVLVDGLEGMAEMEQEALAATLEVFLSSLFLFEDARFHYKLFLPASLEPSLVASSAVERQRVSVFRLHWSGQELKEIAARRLALAAGMEKAAFKMIFTDEHRLTDWFHRCAGASPRAYLEAMRPILAHYLEIAAHEKARPLKEEEWLRARRHSALRFVFDPDSGELTVGARKVPDLTVAEVAILRYLYRYRDQVVSKERLYRDVILPFYGDAFIQDPAGLHPADYEDAINTALWRLRKAIEPDPKKPTFLISERDKGVVLRTTG